MGEGGRAAGDMGDVAAVVSHSKEHERMKRVRKPDLRHPCAGTTFFEVVAVVVIVLILAGFIAGGVPQLDIDLQSQRNTVHNHLRFAQSRAMHTGQVWSVQFAANGYTVFSQEETGNPQTVRMRTDDDGNDFYQLGGAAVSTSLAGNQIWFGPRGVPMSAYTPTSETELANNFVVTLSQDGQSETVTVIPVSGYVQ
jgi:Tfp pilus assembly protein FimT